MLEGLPVTVHRDPVLSIVTAGDSPHPDQRAGTPVLSLGREKR
jgi:hypothetical protein